MSFLPIWSDSDFNTQYLVDRSELSCALISFTQIIFLSVYRRYNRCLNWDHGFLGGRSPFLRHWLTCLRPVNMIDLVLLFTHLSSFSLAESFKLTCILLLAVVAAADRKSVHSASSTHHWIQGLPYYVVLFSSVREGALLSQWRCHCKLFFTSQTCHSLVVWM